MPLDLSGLEASVVEFETVEPGVEALLTQLFNEVEAHKGDPVAIQGIVDRVRAQVSALSAAVVANTPVGPATPKPDSPAFTPKAKH